jgi:SDR family mycofactocin-dependent oxidoreductase
MSQLDGKVVFVTGAASGLGRSAAALLAEEGADIIGLDICQQVTTVAGPMATEEDLAETVALVEKTGRRMIGVKGDVRHRADIRRALDQGLAEFGRLDVVLANAGIFACDLKPFDRSEEAWQDSIDIMLTGTWNTLQLTAPILVDQGEGGAIVIVSSSVTRRWITTNYDGGFDGYAAAKCGVDGLMTGYAGRLAEHNIRVNTINPTGFATPINTTEHATRWRDENPEFMAAFANALPVASMKPVDVSRAIQFLVSDTGKYMTGQAVFIDAGQTSVPPIGGGTRQQH